MDLVLARALVKISAAVVVNEVLDSRVWCSFSSSSLCFSVSERRGQKAEFWPYVQVVENLGPAFKFLAKSDFRYRGDMCT